MPFILNVSHLDYTLPKYSNVIIKNEFDFLQNSERTRAVIKNRCDCQFAEKKKKKKTSTFIYFKTILRKRLVATVKYSAVRVKYVSLTLFLLPSLFRGLSEYPE